MDTKQANAAVTEYLSHIRATVANRLRTSRHYGEWNVDDMTQEVVEYLLRVTLPAYDPAKGCALKGWITCQVVNLCNNFFDRACNRFGHDSIDPTDESAEDDSPGLALPDSKPSAFASLLRSQQHAAMTAAIERVCNETERAFLSAYLATESLSKAARSVGRSPAWATIAMKAIRAKVAREVG
jgi:DNA-directed RNA polymerase specialized sigma24 family protein